MDKYIEAFCEQNPIFNFSCQNPECKKSHSLKSKIVFSKKVYDFECPDCGKTTAIDTSQFTKDFVEQMKKLGITVQ